MDRKCHVDTLILIPTLKIYVFWYSGRTDGDINLAWASLTTFLQEKSFLENTRCTWAGWTVLHCLRMVPRAHSRSVCVLQESGWKYMQTISNFILYDCSCWTQIFFSYIGIGIWRGWTTDRKLHMDTLILIPTWKFYVFWYSKRTDRWTDGQTDREIYPVWASLTTFLQVHSLRMGWRNPFLKQKMVPPAHTQQVYLAMDM